MDTLIYTVRAPFTDYPVATSWGLSVGSLSQLSLRASPFSRQARRPWLACGGRRARRRPRWRRPQRGPLRGASARKAHRLQEGAEPHSPHSQPSPPRIGLAEGEGEGEGESEGEGRGYEGYC